MILAVVNAIYAMRKKPEKDSGLQQEFESVTRRYRCDALTNRAMKPLMLGAGQLCVQSPANWFQASYLNALSLLNCLRKSAH